MYVELLTVQFTYLAIFSSDVKTGEDANEVK